MSARCWSRTQAGRQTREAAPDVARGVGGLTLRSFPYTVVCEVRDDLIRARATPSCRVRSGRSILPGLCPTGFGRHVNRVADVKPHDHRRAAFSGGKLHDF